MIYLIQENGVMTLSGWNVDLFEFSDCSVLATFLSCIILQTNEEELMLKHYHVCQTPYFHVGKIVIWPQVVNLKML